MSMVTLSVVVFYGLVGWICRPKSNYEKMKEQQARDLGVKEENLKYSENTVFDGDVTADEDE
jgi:hypothetical protein